MSGGRYRRRFCVDGSFDVGRSNPVFISKFSSDEKSCSSGSLSRRAAAAAVVEWGESRQVVTRLLSREPLDRSEEDIRRICSFLSDICRPFRSLSRHAKAMLAATTVRLRSLGEGCRVYEMSDRIDCWFVLLSGSVRMTDGEVIYDSGSVFGRKRRGCSRRESTCIVMEDATQILVIEYLSDGSMDEDLPSESHDVKSSSSEHQHHNQVLVSLQKEPADRSDYDLGRIVRFMGSFSAFDELSRSCLTVKRDIARVIVLAVVYEANTVIMSEGEQYDAWSVIISGTVQNTTIDSNGLTRTVVMGVNDSFGCMQLDRHKGVLKTLCNNCRFLCIPKDDYFSLVRRYGLCCLQDNRKPRSLSANAMDLPPGYRPFVRCDPNHILLTNTASGSREPFDNEGGNHANIPLDSSPTTRADACPAPIRSTRQELLEHLVKASASCDFRYVGHYLLTHRAFGQCSIDVCEKLIACFRSQSVNREAVVNVLLQWIAKYGWDFEQSRKLAKMLDDFIELVYAHRMYACLRLLAIASTAAQSSTRSIVIPRNNRDEKLCFEVAVASSSGQQSHDSVFVVNVQPNSKAAINGLRRGDEIIEVNGHLLHQSSGNIAVIDIMRQTTHLCLKVQFNLAGYYEMISLADKHGSYEEDEDDWTTQMRPSDLVNDDSRRGKVASVDESGQKRSRMMAMSRRLIGAWLVGSSSLPPSSPLKPSNNLRSPKSIWKWRKFRPSTPGTDLAATIPLLALPSPPDQIDFVIKIYISDDSFKLLKINKLTSAHDAASAVLCSQDSAAVGSPLSALHQVALYELTHESLSYWKQKRLPDQLDNLAGRLPFGSRYYVKSTSMVTSTPIASRSSFSGSMLPPGTFVNETSSDQLNLLTVDIYELASQLSLRAYSMFSRIRPQEYVSHVFNLAGSYDKRRPSIERDVFSSANLDEFSSLVNREMYWVVSEIVRESSTHRRALVIKKFIKLARICKELKNFNSVLTIVSGLGHKAVSRLHGTWARVPDKTKKTYADLQSLLDPSRNMLNYRSLFRDRDVGPPIVPMFPICIKDLVYIHQANRCRLDPTQLDEMINFEKFRRLSKEIDLICGMKRGQDRFLEAYSELPVPFWQVFRAFECDGTIRHLADRLAATSISTRGASFENGASPLGSVRQSWLRKRYEQTEKTRQARAYLDTVEVIIDERSLLGMSVAESLDKQSPPVHRKISSSLEKQVHHHDMSRRASSAVPSIVALDGSILSNSTTTTPPPPPIVNPSTSIEPDDSADSLNSRTTNSVMITGANLPKESNYHSLNR